MHGMSGKDLEQLILQKLGQPKPQPNPVRRHDLGPSWREVGGNFLQEFLDRARGGWFN